MWKNLEGWHNKVKTITRKIWLKLEQASTEVSTRQLMAGGTLRSVPPKQSTKERRIKKTEEKFANGVYTLASALSFWVGFLIYISNTNVCLYFVNAVTLQ